MQHRSDRNLISRIRERAAAAVLAMLVVLVPGMVATPSAQAQTFTTLHSFDGTDGTNPYAGLVQATNGNLYGTTNAGGANSVGTVFKITPKGTLTTLHSFDGTDGSYPYAGLVQATDGNFYGTTYIGGANGQGTVFKITPSGTLTTLYSFCSQGGFNCTDGADPLAGLVLATNGDFYGTTQYGGANCIANGGCGTVFSITPSGTLTTLHSFAGYPTDGSNPQGALVQGTDGSLYGTTVQDGPNCIADGGCGTVFKITPSGTLTTLYNFCSQGGSNCTDGKYPNAGLIQGTNGDFYGTASAGGANCTAYGGCGTIFKIIPSGMLTTLYNFCSQGGSNCTDGAQPDAGLVQGTDGNFYGTTVSSGANNDGTAFSITPSGSTLTTLHSFDGTDGYQPYATLVQATCGKFYGTTYAGGTNNDGTVFSLSVGLVPFVATNPTSGEVGKAVKILGTNLTGATSVTFNGTAATFTVKSKSEITTTVPTGATTGTVKVVTPRRTLSSNVPFRVRP
jgi:uncharacterized repeat protein (TIGR03803 family)